MKTARDRLIVALDAATATEALALAQRLRGLVRTVKVGSILFTAEGPVVIRRLRRLGFRVMLDLKFHDIPSTVEGSCRAAVRYRIASLTVHGGGGPEMLRAAVRGVRDETRQLRISMPEVLAVTVLTSDVRQALPARRSRVLTLAREALDAGCEGIVASARDVGLIRRRFGRRLRVICPGIRPGGSRLDDQQRVATPEAAIRAGADMLVVGRPITAAANPRAAAQAILKDMEAAC